MKYSYATSQTFQAALQLEPMISEWKFARIGADTLRDLCVDNASKWKVSPSTAQISAQFLVASGMLEPVYGKDAKRPYEFIIHRPNKTAKGFDLSAMSTDELGDLVVLVASELMSRCES